MQTHSTSAARPESFCTCQLVLATGWSLEDGGPLGKLIREFESLEQGLLAYDRIKCAMRTRESIGLLVLIDDANEIIAGDTAVRLLAAEAASAIAETTYWPTDMIQ